MSLTLEDNQLKEVRSILESIVPGISVWAFGSRVTGRAKPFSDLDLALVSANPVSKDTLWDLQESFSESELPFRVDIIDLAVAPPEIKAAVERNNIPL